MTDTSEHLTNLRHSLLKENPDWKTVRFLLVHWLASEEPDIGVGLDYVMQTLNSLSRLVHLPSLWHLKTSRIWSGN